MAEELGGFLQNIEELKKLLGGKEYINAFDNLSASIRDINNAFLETRTRVLELSTALSDSVAGVTRLGGSLEQTEKTIIGIASGARRNVVAAAESVQEIYATATLLGKTAESIVEDFAQIGYTFDEIGEKSAESIQYLQSMGLNAKTIMGDVLSDFTLMNRFNFEDGVMGLTKMAAQASMLRFDMGETQFLADKVMDPEGAIQIASTFQRLGVTMGELIDPFVLMDSSINDPGKLQDSMINLAKSYAQFNEETNRFEINPYGIRMLKEIGDQTGLNVENLKKSALAALELDSRLSDINFNINATEEDKTMIANLAQKKDGEYVVKIYDEQRGEEFVKLSEITTDQFDKLVKQQESAPKTIEEIQREQLDVTQRMRNDTRALVDYFQYGFVGQTGFRRVSEDVTTIYEDFSTSLNKSVPTQEELRQLFEGVGNNLRDLVMTAFKSGNSVDIENALTKLAEQKDDLTAGTARTLEKMLRELGTNMPKETYSMVGGGYKELVGSIKKLTNTLDSRDNTFSGELDLNGDININVNTPGVDRATVQALFRDREFQNLLHEIVRERAEQQIRELNRSN